MFKVPDQSAVGIVDFFYKIIKVLHIDIQQLQIGVRNFVEFLELFIYSLENSTYSSTKSMENLFKILTSS